MGKRKVKREEALKAWRTNPLARRIINLTTEYVIGEGFTVKCEHEPTLKFLKQF